ncbi:uncharacterized protein LOC126194807 [Schistocerca nitens]|uniref:uncharacterized protein LOC126194807 n=1 Tax=Schistocerca nitens TaxID=7011 RepID=UPI0021189FF1|nr:uncharacterized protein LOC126194807 [Schistocerca nitens]
MRITPLKMFARWTNPWWEQQPVTPRKYNHLLMLLALYFEQQLSQHQSSTVDSQQIQSLVEAIAKQAANPPPPKEQAQAAPPFHLDRGGFQPRLPTSLPPPGQQQQPSPLPRRQPVPLMPPAQLHAGAPRVVAPAPAVPLQSPPPSELMDVDPSAGPTSQAVAVQPVLQPLSLGTPKESDTAAPCPAPTQQPSTQRQETLPLFVGPDAPSRPVPEAAPVVTGVHPDLGFQSVFPEAPRSQCWGADRGLPPTTVSAPRQAGLGAADTAITAAAAAAAAQVAAGHGAR